MCVRPCQWLRCAGDAERPQVEEKVTHKPEREWTALEMEIECKRIYDEASKLEPAIDAMVGRAAGSGAGGRPGLHG